MRKIQTQAEIDKKKKKNQIIIGVVLIGLLIIAPLGYSLFSGDGDKDVSKVNEMGIDFFKQNGIWVTQIDDTVFGFKNLPSEVSDVDVNISIGLEQYVGKPLYFVNPNEGVSEVLNNMGKYILRYQESCLRQDSDGSWELGVGSDDDGLWNGDCEGDLPVKDCDSNIIIFESGNSSEVYQNNNCIFIVGDSLNATDAFLYKVLSIS